MWSSCNIYRALIHRWQVFFSATCPPLLPSTHPSKARGFFFLSVAIWISEKANCIDISGGEEGLGVLRCCPPLSLSLLFCPPLALSLSLSGSLVLWLSSSSLHCSLNIGCDVFFPPHLLHFSRGKWALIQTLWGMGDDITVENRPFKDFFLTPAGAVRSPGTCSTSGPAWCFGVRD